MRCQIAKAAALRMTPADCSSLAMRRLEYPGRKSTNVCPAGLTGCVSAQASHPPKARQATKKIEKNTRILSISLDEAAQQVAGRWSLAIGHLPAARQVPTAKCQLLSAAPGIHPALQNQHRRHLVDHLAAALDGHFGFAQEAVSLG